MKTAVRSLRFILEGGAPEFIDIAECLSLVNRQGYKQGNLFLLESIQWIPDGTKDSVQINCLPSSWTVYQSWKKAKRLWDKMNRKAGVAYPAYHDYKVFFDAGHYTGWVPNGNQLPVDGSTNPFSNIGREWRYSQYVNPIAGGAAAADENACHMLGDDTGANNAAMTTDGSRAIIQMYGDTRVTVGAKEPELPDDASTSWATDLFDDGSTQTDVVGHLESVNDQPPYAHALDAQGGDNPIYIGGSESGIGGHRLASIHPIDEETTYSPGGDVPLGLLQVMGAPGGKLILEIASGPYQGVAAMPMGKVPT